MRKRWTAASMLVAEQQFRRIIGYRHLAKLVIAIEHHRARYRLTVKPRGSPSKFHDDPDILLPQDGRGLDRSRRRDQFSVSGARRTERVAKVSVSIE
jgi:hypothetical protein